MFDLFVVVCWRSHVTLASPSVATDSSLAVSAASLAAASLFAVLRRLSLVQETLQKSCLSVVHLMRKDLQNHPESKHALGSTSTNTTNPQQCAQLYIITNKSQNTIYVCLCTPYLINCAIKKNLPPSPSVQKRSYHPPVSLPSVSSRNTLLNHFLSFGCHSFQ